MGVKIFNPKMFRMKLICSLIVHFPLNLSPFLIQRMASYPLSIFLAVWKDWKQPFFGITLFNLKWSFSIPCCRDFLVLWKLWLGRICSFFMVRIVFGKVTALSVPIREHNVILNDLTCYDQRLLHALRTTLLYLDSLNNNAHISW